MPVCFALTTKRYARLADDPLRVATGRFGAKIAAFKAGFEAEVVPLPVLRSVKS